MLRLVRVDARLHRERPSAGFTIIVLNPIFFKVDKLGHEMCLSISTRARKASPAMEQQHDYQLKGMHRPLRNEVRIATKAFADYKHSANHS